MCARSRSRYLYSCTPVCLCVCMCVTLSKRTEFRKRIFIYLGIHRHNIHEFLRCFYSGLRQQRTEICKHVPVRVCVCVCLCVCVYKQIYIQINIHTYKQSDKFVCFFDSSLRRHRTEIRKHVCDSLSLSLSVCVCVSVSMSVCTYKYTYI
jgi:hypothetical protein